MFTPNKKQAKPPGGKPPGKPPEECPPSTGATGMSNKCVVTVTTELPPAQAEWKVDLGADPEQGLIYGNLAYDLVAAAIAKLGVEYSKYILGKQSGDQFNAEMTSVLNTLKAGTVAG